MAGAARARAGQKKQGKAFRTRRSICSLFRGSVSFRSARAPIMPFSGVLICNGDEEPMEFSIQQQRVENIAVSFLQG